jgi:hypothetical protein
MNVVNSLELGGSVVGVCTVVWSFVPITRLVGKSCNPPKHTGHGLYIILRVELAAPTARPRWYFDA